MKEASSVVENVSHDMHLIETVVSSASMESEYTFDVPFALCSVVWLVCHGVDLTSHLFQM